MENNYREKIVKVSVWLIIFAVLFAGLNFLAQPVWRGWNNYDTMHGFYGEPQDTIEVVFLGTSCVVNSITPMELYEDYGICAYNLGTEQQPMMASYYWLKEAYRRHTHTLKTVVLDTSALRFFQDLAFYRKAIDGMEMSAIKYDAVRDYSQKNGDTIANLLPLYAYHDRWKCLDETDFQKFNYSVNACVRGYNFTTDRYLDSDDTLQIFPYFADEGEDKGFLNMEAVDYFEKIIDFCNENSLNLLLVRLGSWRSYDHNMVKSMAEMYDLDFLDFSFEPLISEIEFNRAVDTTDPAHSNYYGAKKLTAYIGNYLKTKYNLSDVREDKKYFYMKEQLNEYHASVSDVMQIKEMTDPREYLYTAVSNTDYTVFIIVKNEAAGCLTQEQREGFATMGLTKLSTLACRDSYLAVFDRGLLVCEQMEHEDNAGGKNKKTGPLSYRGNLSNGMGYVLESGGALMGDKASCLINGIEYAKNQQGINIVLYNNNTEKVIDTTWFDTSASSTRDGENLIVALENAEKSEKSYLELSEDLQKLYMYNRNCENQRTAECLKQEIADNGLFSYLSTYGKEDYIIYISVNDGAAGALDSAARASLADYGLTELSQLEWRDSYLAVINSGQVVYEKKDHGSEPITTRYFNHTLQSGGSESGDCRSSIIIDGVQYSPNTRGINIVVYDTATKMVVDTAVFDTCVNPIKLLDMEVKQ